MLAQLKTVALIKEAIKLAFFRRVEYLEHLECVCAWCEWCVCAWYVCVSGVCMCVCVHVYNLDIEREL
jgi:hypothetical protein